MSKSKKHDTLTSRWRLSFCLAKAIARLLGVPTPKRNNAEAGDRFDDWLGGFVAEVEAMETKEDFYKWLTSKAKGAM